VSCFGWGEWTPATSLLPCGSCPPPAATNRCSLDSARGLRRGDVLQASLRYPSAAISAARLRWQLEEKLAGERLQADLDPLARQTLLTAAAADGLDERAAVADLWATACALRGSAEAVAPSCAEPSATDAAALWQELVGRLGDQWTLATLLAHLTGEDPPPVLAGNADSPSRRTSRSGPRRLAKPGACARVLCRLATERRQRLGLGTRRVFAGARHDIEQLPDDPLQAISSERLRLGLSEAHWEAYLQRLALELPGWAGMFAWRESHTRGDDAPVSLADFIAVRVVLERLYGEQLLRRIWGLPLRLADLGDYFISHPAELSVPARLRQSAVAGRSARSAATAAGGAGRPRGERVGSSSPSALQQSPSAGATTTDAAALAAWPLFVLAQRLGLSGRELRDLGALAADALLCCADSLTQRAARPGLAAGLRAPLPAADPCRAGRQPWPRPCATRQAGGAVRFMYGRPRGRHTAPPRRSQSGLRDLRRCRIFWPADALAGPRRRGTDGLVSDRRAPGERAARGNSVRRRGSLPPASAPAAAAPDLARALAPGQPARLPASRSGDGRRSAHSPARSAGADDRTGAPRATAWPLA
jgi:hypothetical protein